MHTGPLHITRTEKAGLLTPGWTTSGSRTNFTTAGALQTCVGNFGAVGAAAVYFAVTSGLRADLVNDARQDPSTVWGRYED